jgi:hypothetical protein
MKKIIILILSIGMCFAMVSCNKTGGMSDSSVSMEHSDETSSSEITSEEINEDLPSSQDSASDSSEEEETQWITVTFKQGGQVDIVKKVEKGGMLTDIPTPAPKAGYIVEWESVDFTNLTEDMTVNAIETAKTYTLSLNANGGSVMQTTITVTYGQAYKLMIPTKENKVFDGWFYNGIHISLSGIWEIDTDEAEVTLIAEWSNGGWTGNY